MQARDYNWETHATSPEIDMSQIPQIIIETDIFTDVDDVGALAIAHTFADEGKAELISIGVNTPSRFGEVAVRVVNAFFGRQVPVGALLPLDDSVTDHDYARYLTTTYPELVPRFETEAAVRTHRAALSSADDGNVTVISLGFFANFRDLLASAGDDISPLTGRELIARKVARFVIMGGYFPTGVEYNIAEFAETAKGVIDAWPTPIEFLGWEVGAPVVTGSSISLDGAENVVGAAYRHFGGAGHGRESWDPLAAHFALAPQSRFYRLSPPGTVTVDAAGSTSFVESPDGHHRYVILNADPVVIAAGIDEIFERGTRRHLQHQGFSTD